VPLDTDVAVLSQIKLNSSSGSSTPNVIGSPISQGTEASLI